MDRVREALKLPLPNEALLIQQKAQSLVDCPLWIINVPIFTQMEHELKSPEAAETFWALATQEWVAASEHPQTKTSTPGVLLLWDGWRVRGALACLLDTHKSKASQWLAQWQQAGMLHVRAQVQMHQTLRDHAYCNRMSWADENQLTDIQPVPEASAWGGLVEGRANPREISPIQASLLRQLGQDSGVSLSQAKELAKTVAAQVLPHLEKVKGSARGPLTRDEKTAQMVLSRLDQLLEGWAHAAGGSVEDLAPSEAEHQALNQARKTMARRLKRQEGSTTGISDETHSPASGDLAPTPSVGWSAAQRRSRRAMGLSAAKELDVEGVQMVADSGLHGEDWSGPTARICLLMELSEATSMAAWGNRNPQETPPSVRSAKASGQAAAILKIALNHGFDLLHDASVGVGASGNPVDKLLLGWRRDPQGVFRSSWLAALCQQMRAQGVSEADGLAWIAQAQTPQERANRTAQNSIATGQTGAFAFAFLRESAELADFVQTLSAAWERECLFNVLSSTLGAQQKKEDKTPSSRGSTVRRRAL